MSVGFRQITIIIHSSCETFIAFNKLASTPWAHASVVSSSPLRIYSMYSNIGLTLTYVIFTDITAVQEIYLTMTKQSNIMKKRERMELLCLLDLVAVELKFTLSMTSALLERIQEREGRFRLMWVLAINQMICGLVWLLLTQVWLPQLPKWCII